LDKESALQFEEKRALQVQQSAGWMQCVQALRHVVEKTPRQWKQCARAALSARHAPRQVLRSDTATFFSFDSLQRSARIQSVDTPEYYIHVRQDRNRDAWL